MCVFTHLSCVISPTARVIRGHTTRTDVVGPFEGIANIQGLRWLGHHHVHLHSKNILREHLQNRSSWHIQKTLRISSISRASHILNGIYTSMYTYMYVYIYMYIYIYIVCVCVCVHHAQRLNKNTANTEAICKNAFYVAWWVKAGSTHSCSLEEHVYI
jgi:hypothetical protein